LIGRDLAVHNIGLAGLLRQDIGGDDERAIDDARRILHGHPPREGGAAELDGLRPDVDRLPQPKVLAGALEQFAPVHDVVDVHAALPDGGLEALHDVVEGGAALVDRIAARGLGRLGRG
jgi:hypothetical protein